MDMPCLQWRVATLRARSTRHAGRPVGAGVHGRRRLRLFIVT